jgi:hypothetical protein
MFISGPRTSTLGSETGTTSCALMMGQGGDHITSSAIFHYGNATCFYGNSYINNTGLACFADTVCANTFKSKNLIVCEGSSNATIASSNNEVLRIQGLCSAGMFTSFMSGSTVLGDIGNTSQIFSSGNATGFGANARGCRTLEFGTNQASRLSIALSGEATFACQVCAPSAVISNSLGVGVAVPQGTLEVCGLSYFTRANNSLLINPNYGGANTHVQLQVVCNMGLAFATNADCERMRITNGGNIGIGTCVPNAKLTVWTPSTTGLQTALRLNNQYGFDNQNTGAQIKFTQDRSVAEDLKQGIIAVGQQDAGTSATSYMAFYTNNTGLGERLRISSTGIACFQNTVCAPIFRASNRLISNFTQIYNSDFTISTGQTRSVVICGGILTTGDFHLMMYGNAGSGMGSIRFSTYGYFANSDLLGFCEHLRSTFGSAAISNVSNNGTSISFNIANCSVSHVISGNWRMISTVGDDANQSLSVFVL